MKLEITNINPPDKEDNFITANIHLTDIFNNNNGDLLSPSISCLVRIEKDDASLSEIRALSLGQLRNLLKTALEKIDTV